MFLSKALQKKKKKIPNKIILFETVKGVLKLPVNNKTYINKKKYVYL